MCSHKWKIQNISDGIFSFCCLGWDFEALGVPRWSKKIQTWTCGTSNRRGWRAEQNASKILILWSYGWPWGEVKGQLSLNFGNHVNFKDSYTKLCVCCHKWKIRNISDGIFILSHNSCPRGGIWDTIGVPRVFFPNMVIWHIKSTGMKSRTECKQHFPSRV